MRLVDKIDFELAEITEEMLVNVGGGGGSTIDPQGGNDRGGGMDPNG